MGQALYRKYRSKKLSELVGQEHITSTLENALKKGTVSHAYLFTGPRGTGKTSVARILAHEVNKLPYDESNHLDIIEIDAASNRRIDEIRDLREHVHSAPTTGKYKVYIIDEVHMLTKEAFNALLKTLEEPPEHVIFILATTEAHKLPETIISRTQRFTFKPVEADQVISHLKHIASSEGVPIEDEALALIAEHGQGSFRDSISLLDQVRTGRDKITANQVRDTLGIAPDSAIEALLTALEAGSGSVLIQTLEDLRQNGYHTPSLAKQLGSKLRAQILSDDTVLPVQTTLRLLKRLIDVPSSHDPDTLLELILLQALPHNEQMPRKATPKAKDIIKEHPEPLIEPLPVLPVDDVQRVQERVELTKEEMILDEDTWQEALLELKKNHNTLYGIARMATPTFTDNTVTLSFKFAFHQKRLNDAKNKSVLADILARLLGTPVEVVCIVDKAQTIPKKSTEKPAKNDLDTISNIFGGAEMLE